MPSRLVILASAIMAAAIGTAAAANLERLGYRWLMPAWLAPPPVPDDNPMSAVKVDLGRHLFYDARLSVDGSVSCASCHLQELAFSDGRAVSTGVFGIKGHRNAPGLANVGYNPALTWANPHADTLEFQSLFPLFGTEPVEMGLGGKENDLFRLLRADGYYADAFAEAFPERDGVIDLFTLTRALAAFQRSLISVDSPYDRYKYGGDSTAIGPAAKRGEQLFFDHRFECYHCHMGVMFTDNLQTARSPFVETAFHNNGLYNIGGSGAYPPRSEGLAEFTGRTGDIGKFRTPSLRNVAVTAPYMHDGSIATFRDVLDHYAVGGRTIAEGPLAGVGADHPNKSGLLIGFEATEQEIADLIAFLESLTDQTFLTNTAYGDPWPEGHPARATRIMPDSGEVK